MYFLSNPRAVTLIFNQQRENRRIFSQEHVNNFHGQV